MNEKANVMKEEANGMNQDANKMVSELLEVVSAKVPKLISELLKTLYSEEAGSQMGKAIGKFYKELLMPAFPKRKH